MRWLFQLKVGGEGTDGRKELAAGTGHAMRCLCLAQIVKQYYFAEVLFELQGNTEHRNYFEKLGVPVASDGCEREVLDNFRPTVIVLDINYLEPEKVLWYRRWAPVVNLAPRGLPKYYADVTFSASAVDDVSHPPKPYAMWYRGPKYAIVRQDFVKLREEIPALHQRRQEDGVVVSMGGKDYHNLTAAVVKALSAHGFKHRIKVIVGPLYPYMAELRDLLESLNLCADLVVDPPDFPREIAEAQLGIFAVGLTTYEALCVGVPSVNISLTRFHEMVSGELEDLGAVASAGGHEKLDESSLSILISEILDNRVRLDNMRRRGIELVDGMGARRVVDKVVKMFEKVES